MLCLAEINLEKNALLVSQICMHLKSCKSTLVQYICHNNKLIPQNDDDDDDDEGRGQGEEKQETQHGQCNNVTGLGKKQKLYSQIPHE